MTVHYSTVHDSTLQFSASQYITAQCMTVHLLDGMCDSPWYSLYTFV